MNSEGTEISKSIKSKTKTSTGSKLCTLCHQPRNVLVRCQIDDTNQWHFVCTGACWQNVSGGVEDGDKEHPHYRYGGMWKNKHEAVSAKKPKGVHKKKADTEREAEHSAAQTQAEGEQNGEVQCESS